MVCYNVFMGSRRSKDRLAVGLYIYIYIYVCDTFIHLGSKSAIEAKIDECEDNNVLMENQHESLVIHIHMHASHSQTCKYLLYTGSKQVRKYRKKRICEYSMRLLMMIILT